MPNNTKWMFLRKSFADLTRQDRALDRRNDGSVKLDQHRLRRKFAYELAFITQDGPAFLFQFLLREMIPAVIVEWIGGDGCINFPTGGERPRPEIFVLDIAEEPRNRLIMGPFPGQDRSRLLHVEVRIGKASEGFFRGDVMIEYEERLRLSSHGFQRLAGIAEIHDDDSLVL